LPVNPLCYNNCTVGTEAPSSAPSAESSTAQEPTSGVASMSPMTSLVLVAAWTVKRCLF